MVTSYIGVRGTYQGWLRDTQFEKEKTSPTRIARQDLRIDGQLVTYIWETCLLDKPKQAEQHKNPSRNQSTIINVLSALLRMKGTTSQALRMQSDPTGKVVEEVLSLMRILKITPTGVKWWLS